MNNKIFKVSTITLVSLFAGYLIINQLVKPEMIYQDPAIEEHHKVVINSLSEITAKNNNNAVFKDKKIVIGGCARDVQKYLPSVFDNIIKICNLFGDYQIIIYHDQSKRDNTLQYLKDYEKASNNHLILINHPEYVSKYRTYRLAFGRNKIIEKIERDFSDFDFFINIDLDDVSSSKMNIDNLIKTIALENKYDVATFARNDGYYDIWALRYEPFLINQHDVSRDDEITESYINKINADILNKLSKLKDNAFFEVESAFNGLGIYKIAQFNGCRYSGKNILFKAPNGRNKKEDCEHVYFHHCLKEKNNAKIVISPRKIF